MKHLAKIQSEFMRYASNWDNLSYEEQKAYLERHPQSKRKITAQPSQTESSNDDQKKQELRNRKKEFLQKLKLHGAEPDSSKQEKRRKLKSDSLKKDRKMNQKLYGLN